MILSLSHLFMQSSFRQQLSFRVALQQLHITGWMEVNDEDIQVLMKLTLLTTTNKKIRAIIPYLKKFCPKVELTMNISTFIPLFHTLQLETLTEIHQETATIDLSPLIQTPNHEHYLNVQTYSILSPQKAGSRYAFHLQFAQIIVKSQQANYLQVAFKSILLKVADQKVRQLRPYLRVTVSHGSTWSGKEKSGNQLMSYDQSTTLIFHSLLDTVVMQLYNEKTKLCEAKRFIFQLIGQGSKIFEMEGQIIKKASVKVSSRATLPIVIID